MGAVLVALALVAYNNLANLWGPFRGWAYVPMNLAATAAVVAAGAGALGLDRGALGFTGSTWAGVAAGAAIGTACALPALAAALHPRARRLVADRRMRDIRGRVLVFRVLVRVPLGTALLEEVAFRGVLYGAWRPHGAVAAAAGSSVAFGLWHLAPTLNLVSANRPGTGRGRAAGAAAGAAVLTAVAGTGFAALREASGGVAAPLALHASLNSLASLASALAWARILPALPE